MWTAPACLISPAVLATGLIAQENVISLEPIRSGSVVRTRGDSA